MLTDVSEAQYGISCKQHKCTVPPTPAAAAQVFEVDQSIVLRAKRDLLPSPVVGEQRADTTGLIGAAKVVDVAADLSVPGWEEKLLEAGFDPNLSSAWILEGLTM